MNVLQHTRNELNLCLKQNRPDRSYGDTLLTTRKGWSTRATRIFFCGTSFSFTETLSALLFNLYDNDLPSAFQNTLSDPIILPNGTKLNSLLYADHFIIISRSKIGLQNCLNTLSSFCNSWMLDINSKKTKVMIFQKRAKKNSSFRIPYR